MKPTTPSLNHLVETFLLCCATEGKSPKTIQWYGANLKRFSKYLDDNHLPNRVTETGTAEVRAFIFHLQNNVRRWETSPSVKDQNRLSPFSVHGYARTIKAFWSWLLIEGYIQTNPMNKLKPPKVPCKIIPSLSMEHIQRLLSMLDTHTPRGFRDFTTIHLFFDTGIRLSELVNLDIQNIDFQQSCFTVNGKGNRERIVPFGSQTRRTLRRYITSFRPEPDSPRVSQLLLTDQGLPLKPRAVQSMLTRLGRRSGITGVRISPHTFRHSFARQYLMCGGDVFSLQQILGHKSLEIVKIYINLASGDISEQHRRFSPVDNMIPLGNRRQRRITRNAAAGQVSQQVLLSGKLLNLRL
jgi:integrase/recombinase XerD